MNISTTTTARPNTQHFRFDIHEKLKMNIKNGGHSHSYLKSAQPHQGDANFEFITILIPDVEFLLYERTGSYFVLVDFFTNYDGACEEAKKIIDDLNLKSSIDGWASYQTERPQPRTNS